MKKLRVLRRRRPVDSGEHLWLTSLSDLMILLFCTFVVMFSFTYKKLKQADFEKIAATLANKPQPKNPIDEINDNLIKWMKEQGLEDQISIEKSEESIAIEIKDKVFFGSGEYSLSSDGASRLTSLSKTLEKVPSRYKIGIEGHTDDIPIHTKEVRDNWELSSKRALSVLYALGFSKDMEKRTSVIALGDTAPLFPNRDAQGNPLTDNQSRNRRVTFRIF